MTRARELLRSRTTWAVTSAAGLFVALVLPPAAPGVLFWGALGLSSGSAAVWGALADGKGGRTDLPRPG